MAHLLDVAGAHERLPTIGPRRSLLDADAVRLFGTHRVSDPEQAVIDRLALRVEDLAAVRDDLTGVAARTRDWATRFDCVLVLVHVDAGVLDHDRFPIVENTHSRSGLGLDELGRLIRVLCTLPGWQGLTLTEINPDHAGRRGDELCPAH